MFEKASELRARYRQQAERKAEERRINVAIKQSRKQGFKVSDEQVRKEWRARHRRALARYGVYVNGVRMLPDTPEVQRILDGED